MAVTTRVISVMTLEQVDLRLKELGWKPEAGVKLTLLEKKSVVREMLENLPTVTQAPGGHRNLSRKNKEELNHACVELQIPLTGNETKPQLTRKIKEKQMPTPDALANDMLADFGKYRGRTYEWIWSNDLNYCLWVTDTVVEEGPDKCSLGLKRLAEYIENRRQQQTPAIPGVASASISAAPATLSVLRDTVEDPEAEIESLQRRLEQLQSQLSTRRRKMTEKDADMTNTES